MDERRVDFTQEQWRAIFLKQKLKYEGFLSTLNQMLIEKKERISELEKIHEHEQMKPPPHVVGEREVLQFKLNRAEKEICRLKRILDVKGSGAAGSKEKAIQTERTMNKKEERIVAFNLVLSDVTDAMCEVLKKISPSLEQELSGKGFKPKNRLEFICVSLSVIQDFIEALGIEGTRLKTKNQKLETKNQELQDLQRTLLTVYQERSFKIEELERLIEEKEKRLSLFERKLKKSSSHSRANSPSQSSIPKYDSEPSFTVSDRFKGILKSLSQKYE